MYPATFYQTWRLVAVLIVCPLLCMGIMVPGILLLPNVDWVILTASFVAFGITLAFTLYLVYRRIIQKCLVSLQQNGLTVTMEKQLPFFGQNFTLLWAAITNASGNTDPNGNKAFIQIKTSGYPGNFILSPRDKGLEDPEQWDLWIRMQEQISTYNESPEMEMPITDNGFFSSRYTYFMSVLYVVLILLGLVGNMAGVIDSVKWYHFVFIALVGIVFIGSIVRARKKKSQQG